jgi:hypothetical protein
MPVSTDHLYVVLSKGPAWISEADYRDWYAVHARENVQVPCFSAVRRYQIEPSGIRFQGDAEFTHMALYEYDGDLVGMRKGLEERKQAGQIVLPPWFGEIKFQSWNATAIDERVERGL